MRKIFIGTLLFFVVFLEGMHAQCHSVSLNKTDVEFGYSGGTNYVYATIPNGCPSPTITIDNVPDWATVTISSTSIRIVCQPLSSGFRKQSLVVRINGNTANGFYVKQGTEPPPPPPPPSCSVSGFNNTTLNTAGEDKSITLTFPNCVFAAAYFTFKTYDNQPLPNWISITQLSGNTLRIVAPINTTGSSRSITIVGKATVSGKELSIGATFIQNSCIPNIPSGAVKVENCGSTVLERGNPPTGTTWYWQNTANGTSTSNTAKTITRTTGTVAYIRSKNNSTACWSAARQISYTINQVLTWYSDVDGDGFGDPDITKRQCAQPSGYVRNGNDGCPDLPGNYNGCRYAPPVLSNENYIYTKVYQKAILANGVIKDKADVIENVTYFDGLGRPMQQVAIGASPSAAGSTAQDLITHIAYDDYGRQEEDWLPYRDNEVTGSYRDNDPESQTNEYYRTNYPEDIVTGQENPYSKKKFDSSPLNRVIKQAAPGYDWHLGNGHEIGFDYDVNSTADRVHMFSVDFATEYVPTLINGSESLYPEGALYKTVTRDENWTGGSAHTMEEFTDKQGRVVLKRTYAASDIDSNGNLDPSEQTVSHDTYYVYDDYGNLTYVLPPKMESGSSSLTGIREKLNALGYQYRYDGQNRLIEKKLPGKGGDQQYWEEIVYNKLDQPVMTRDPNLRAAGKWLFTKYDAFGRVAYTGSSNSTASRVSLQGVFDSPSTNINWVDRKDSDHGLAGSIIYYDNIAKPINISAIHTINYYDTYLPSGAVDKVPIPNKNSLGEEISKNAKTLVTVSRVKVLETDDWITTTTGYDNKGRAVWIRTVNDYLNTNDLVEFDLDFTGRVLKSLTTHEKTDQSEPMVIKDTFSYDDMGRLTKQTQKINDQPEELIAENGYDGLGQLVSKKVGNTATSPLQTVDYTYNIRGWLKGINHPESLGNDLFGFGIAYNDIADPSKKLYNGNISQTRWSSNGKNYSGNPVSSSYNYTYDALNRITGALDNTGNYNVSDIAYDKNGNITHLTRQGQTVLDAQENVVQFGAMDDLGYTYDVGNRLVRVADSAAKGQGFVDGANTGNDYSYDANGNMKTDTNKGISDAIIYNHLNLPTSIKLNNTKGNGEISYIYDATGAKLEKTAPGKVIQYAGNYIYEKLGEGDNTLKFFNQPEGYAEKMGSNYNYVYQYKDHLGNVRLSYNGRKDYVMRSDFENDMAGWGDKGWRVDRELDGGRMMTTVIDAYAGTSYALNQISAVPGEKYTINLTLDKATTESAVRFYIEERNSSNGHLSYNMLNTNLLSGQHSYEYTIKEGSFLILRLDKDNTHTDETTHFYIDDVSMNREKYDYVLRSDFESDMDGWGDKGYNVDRTISNGRMETSIIRAYSGTSYALYDVEARTGQKFTINLEMDKASTTSAIRLYVEERDASGHLSYSMLNTNLPSGRHSYEYTVKGGNLLILRLDKDNTHTDKRTSFYLDDVSMSTAGDSDVMIVEEKNYYPFGLEHQGYNTTVVQENNFMTYNGKELEEDLGKNTLAYGWRDYDPAIGRFNKIDRFAEKYVSSTPYNYAANNPMYFIDVQGDSLWIQHKGNQILYANGNVYNKDGTAYTGKGIKVKKDGTTKLTGFLKTAVNGLAAIAQGAEGSSMISELQSSDNNFIIVDAKSSEFKSSDSYKAYANQWATDPAQTGTYAMLQNGGKDFSGGSGGIINWNSSGSSLVTLSGTQTNGTTDLAHEMFHALDANRGLLDARLHNGVNRSEWQATYRENTLRIQLGLPVRSHYRASLNAATGARTGLPPRVLSPAPTNSPILPSWYKK